MKKIYTYILALVASAVPFAAFGQALPFVAADFSPASLSKGGASYADVSDVAYSAFDAPASAAFYDGSMDVSAGFVSWQPTAVKTTVINAAGAYKIGESFAISAGVSYGKNPQYDIIDAIGNVTGAFSPVQMQLGAGFSWRIIPDLALGVNVGYAKSDLAEGVSYGSVLADIQVMTDFDGLKVSAGVADLGSAVTSASGDKFSLPASFRVGASYPFAFAQKQKLEMELDAGYYFTGGFAAAVGASYAFDDMVFVRAGYRYGGKSVIPSYASVGAGVRFAGVKVDLAYVVSSSPMANTLGVSLGYSF